MSRVGDVQSSLPVFTDGCGHSVMDHGRSHHADSRVAMVVVVPGEEGLTESATVLVIRRYPVRFLARVLSLTL